MQQHDARILRGAAIATAASAVAAVGLSALLAGAPGALGAGLASLIILGLFTLGQLLVHYAARLNRDFALPASMLGFVLKIAVLGILLLTLGRSEFMEDLNSTAFAVTALVCVVVWLAAQARGFARARVPHVDPESEGSR